MDLKKFIAYSLLISAIAVCIACTNHSKAIERMVDNLNSEQMQNAERLTGLFSGSKAELKADTLQLTLYLLPEISLAGFSQEQLPTLQQSATEEFRNKTADAEFLAGIKALSQENMMMKIVWLDNAGATVAVIINPNDVLTQ